MFEAIGAQEQGPKREELRRFWWAFENDNFTLMYGQEMNAMVDIKNQYQRGRKGSKTSSTS